MRGVWMRSRVMAELWEARQRAEAEETTKTFPWPQSDRTPKTGQRHKGLGFSCSTSATEWLASTIGCQESEALTALEELSSSGNIETASFFKKGPGVHMVWITKCPEWLPKATDPFADFYADNDTTIVQQQPERSRHITKKVRRSVLERDSYQCVLCGADDDLTLDHVFPWSKGGSNHGINLRVLCRSCNSRKGSALPDTIRFIGRQEVTND